jgi:hypothetical protein
MPIQGAKQTANAQADAPSASQESNEPKGAETPKPNADQVTPTGRKVAPTESVKQDLPTRDESEDETPQSYVWLANGEVLRVDDEDLPTGGGTGAPHGFWQTGNKVHQVVGVYPVESTLKG